MEGEFRTSMRKIIISLAPVSVETPEDTRNPLKPQEIAEEVINCAQEGAALVHLHVRNQQGELTDNLQTFSETTELIRDNSDIIIQGSTGGLSSLSVEERCIALNDPGVECASLNMGSVNFDNEVYINTLPEIRCWATRMKEKGIIPELEIFDGAMINNSKLLMEEGIIERPLNFAFCLGKKGALPASTYNIQFLQGMLPEDAKWGLVHVDMQDLSLLATAIGMGASFVRIGFEDSIYYAKPEYAKTNLILVKRLASLIKNMGLDIATAREAREILGFDKQVSQVS